MVATLRQTFRLYPNQSQERQLFKARRLHQYIYNACLAGRKHAWETEGKSLKYFDQQNKLPQFKKDNPEFATLGSQALQATVKRVDLAFVAFFKGLRKRPKFKSLRNYSGWTYPGSAGWKVYTNGKHGKVELRDNGLSIRMRGKVKQWGNPTTLTIVYRPSLNRWHASFTVEVPTVETKYGSTSDLRYESIIAYDLGTSTALTTYDGSEYVELTNPRFLRNKEQEVKRKSKQMRRKVAPNRKKKIRPSNRWKKARKAVSKLQRKVSNQRQDWQHKVTSDIASRYDIGVTEELRVRNMTRKALKGSKRKRQKAGLNKSILDVGMSTLNKMIGYKIEAKGGLLLVLDTKKVKPSQRCPNCGKVHKHWAQLSNRYHVCDACGFEGERDQGSALVMYQLATNKQPGDGIALVNADVVSSTSISSSPPTQGTLATGCRRLGRRRQVHADR
ncbi:MAG: transposase [Symploca sp. SIO1C4]|uniref:Transposase n=1 Tax=Symploca sp. SIO1C4 TaxID=2607765 RepID=A0A6B3NSP0_9CYAN|nr:transposase [Symploca sp. SIO1C4]